MVASVPLLVLVAGELKPMASTLAVLLAAMVLAGQCSAIDSSFQIKDY